LGDGRSESPQGRTLIKRGRNFLTVQSLVEGGNEKEATAREMSTVPDRWTLEQSDPAPSLLLLLVPASFVLDHPFTLYVTVCSFN
jgi:hypothetical protein